jgi:hypothetical protein
MEENVGDLVGIVNQLVRQRPVGNQDLRWSQRGRDVRQVRRRRGNLAEILVLLL